jgi:hypothetical protein
MNYRFAAQRENYEDLASGRVLYGRPGFPAFPVRLASELFQRCAELLSRQGKPPPYVLFDPCCGGGYLLTVVGLLHGGSLSQVLASDIDEEAVALARRNLSLLTPSGLQARLQELRALIEAYGKPSHHGALESGERLAAGLLPSHFAIHTECFVLDALGEEEWPGSVAGVDIVLVDLPYGWTSAWQGDASPEGAARRLLAKLEAVLAPVAVAGVVADKGQAVGHPAYRRVEVMNAGKRRVRVLAHWKR